MRNLGIKAIGMLIIGIILLQSNIVIAATKTELNNQQSETNQKIEEKKEELNDIKTEKSETLTQVEKLASQISNYQSQIDELDSKIADLNNKIEEAEEKINKKQEEHEKNKKLLEARLVATYEAGETSYLDVILSSERLSDLISNYYLITEVATNDAELLEKIQKEKKEIEEAKQTLETSKNEVSTSKASKQSVATQLQTSKKEKDTYVAQLSAEEKQTQNELEQFEADKRAIANRLAVIAAQEAEERRKQAAANNGKSSTTVITNNPSSSGYINPVPGYSITCPWYGYTNHTGVDFSGSGIAGKSILAVKAGTVITSDALKYSSGSYRSYGEYIIISHGDGTMTLYAHGQAGSRVVSEGQKVSQGQKIMSVGSTGNSTGAHLHFEVRVNGVPVNPAPYLP